MTARRRTARASADRSARFGRAARAALRRGARASAPVLLALLAACASAPKRTAPAIHGEATAALAEAQAWLRLEGSEARRRAYQAASRAAAAEPDWVAPQRILDDLMREDLLGLEALRERQRAARRQPRSGAALYLVGRLEGAEGRRRFTEAVELDGDLAWGYHGLAWIARGEGRPRRAAGFERKALARARGSWERSFFLAALARHLQAGGDTRRAIEVLDERLGQPDVLPVDRISLGVQLALAEMGMLFDEELRERGYRRGLELLRGEGLTADETRALVDRLLRHVGQRSREELVLEIELALAARPGHERERLRAELLSLEGPSALSLGFLERLLRQEGASWADVVETRAAQFAVGAYARGIELWLVTLPAVVLDDQRLPRDPRLARVVRAARAAGDGGGDHAQLSELAEALLEAGWFLEARAVAARLSAFDLDEALALDARAAAGRVLVRVFTRLALAADGARPEALGGGRIEDLDDLLAAMDPVWRRYARILGGEIVTAPVAPQPLGVGPELGDPEPEPGDLEPEPGDLEPEPGDLEPEPGDVEPEPGGSDAERGDSAAEPAERAARAGAGAEVADGPGGDSLTASPRLKYGAFATVLHPGPRFSRSDEAAGLGVAGEPVPGLAQAMDRLGRFAIFGEVLGGRGPDGSILRRVYVAERSGEHLGVPWSGTVAWCEGLELLSRVGREGARIAGAALHEGYWIDLDGPRAELQAWLELRRRFFPRGEPAETTLRALESEALPLESFPPEGRRAERARLLSPLGEGDRVRLAVLRDRLADGGKAPPMRLDEIVRSVAVHEEGHLCDRTRFLPLSRHLGRALRFLLQTGFSPERVQQRLEYRAQLVALCEVGDPRLPLAEVLMFAEASSSADATPHGSAYAELLHDLLSTLSRELDREPERWQHVDPDGYLVHQFHRLRPGDVRELALILARREGLVADTPASASP